MNPKISFLLLGGLSAALSLSACGTPSYCEDEGPKGFSTVRTQNWAPYCEELEARLNEPLNYELTDLTDYFADYPTRAADITEQLSSFDEPDRCFDSKREQLELRSMRSCLEVDEDKEARIQKAWAIRAEPWIEQYEKRIKALRRELNDLNLEATRVDQKISQKFDMNATMESELVDDLTLKLDELQPKIAAVDKAKLDYERFLASSMSNTNFNTFIEESYGTAIKELLDEHENNRFAIAKLRGTERYFRYALNTVGKECEAASSASKETRIVRPLLKDAMSKKSAGPTLSVDAVVSSKDPDTSADIETINGYFCGERSADNQFEGKPQLCAHQHFEILRDRPVGERKWTSWRLVETKEGEVNEGVDCALLEKK